MPGERRGEERRNAGKGHRKKEGIIERERSFLRMDINTSASAKNTRSDLGTRTKQRIPGSSMEFYFSECCDRIAATESDFSEFSDPDSQPIDLSTKKRSPKLGRPRSPLCSAAHPSAPQAAPTRGPLCLRLTLEKREGISLTPPAVQEEVLQARSKRVDSLILNNSPGSCADSSNGLRIVKLYKAERKDGGVERDNQSLCITRWLKTEDQEVEMLEGLGRKGGMAHCIKKEREEEEEGGGEGQAGRSPSSCESGARGPGEGGGLLLIDDKGIPYTVTLAGERVSDSEVLDHTSNSTKLTKSAARTPLIRGKSTVKREGSGIPTDGSAPKLPKTPITEPSVKQEPAPVSQTATGRTQTPEPQIPPRRVLYCEVCFRAFFYLSDLERHSITHSESKPHACAQCGKRFKRSSHLERHKHIHTGQRNFACALCGKRFREAGELLRHQRVHTGEKPYQCEGCRMRFAERNTLRRHTKRKHAREGLYTQGAGAADNKDWYSSSGLGEEGGEEEEVGS
ncbi:zinc finger and SCAN domain-containing protein 2-like [Polyodon spathula]|uniref:zinc finger and SCAN domain-containing protein 2-like n=1 Tax=Polyodon spathula TaxID=7913 RepID=UPI001B7F7282|nr:zinc finger and SCAN domain-containing protein 2-like [Polyodon spathula]